MLPTSISMKLSSEKRIVFFISDLFFDVVNKIEIVISELACVRS